MQYTYTDNIKLFSFRNSDLYKKGSEEKQKAVDALIELFTNNDLMGDKVETRNSINFIKARFDELSGMTKFEMITFCRICDIDIYKVTKLTDMFDLISEWDMNDELAAKLIESKEEEQYKWDDESGRLVPKKPPFEDSTRPSEGMELPKLKKILNT